MHQQKCVLFVQYAFPSVLVCNLKQSRFFLIISIFRYNLTISNKKLHNLIMLIRFMAIDSWMYIFNSHIYIHTHTHKVKGFFIFLANTSQSHKWISDILQLYYRKISKGIWLIFFLQLQLHSVLKSPQKCYIMWTSWVIKKFVTSFFSYV